MTRFVTYGLLAVCSITAAFAGTDQLTEKNSRRGERRVVVIKQDGNQPAERREIILNSDENSPELTKELQEARQMLEELKASSGKITVRKFTDNNESRPFLGVILGAKTADGVILEDVVEGSGAEKAGLQDGDVVSSVDGKTITSAGEISSIIGTKKIGDNVIVRFHRGGSVQTVEATLGKKTERAEIVAKFFGNNGNGRLEVLGNHFDMINGSLQRLNGRLIELENIDWLTEEETGNPCERLHTMQNGALLGVYVNSGGKAMVQNTIENTGAVAAGLKSGDVITSLDGASVGNYDDLRKAVTSHKPGERVQVSFIRNGEAQTVSAVLSSVADTRRELVAKLEASCTEKTPAAPKKGNVGELAGTASVLSVSPNPTTGQITLRLMNTAKETANVTITDAEGRIVLTDRLAAGATELPLDLSGLAKGMYFVAVKQGGREYSDKIVVN